MTCMCLYEDCRVATLRRIVDDAEKALAKELKARPTMKRRSKVYKAWQYSLDELRQEENNHTHRCLGAYAMKDTVHKQLVELLDLPPYEHLTSGLAHRPCPATRLDHLKGGCTCGAAQKNAKLAELKNRVYKALGVSTLPTDWGKLSTEEQHGPEAPENIHT